MLPVGEGFVSAEGYRDLMLPETCAGRAEGLVKVTQGDEN